MNYFKLYNSIIENAQLCEKMRCDVYVEKHHIIPHSLGGNDSKENLVKLTAREHFICHWLLVKIYPKDSIERKKMLHAFFMMKANNMSSQKRYDVSSRVYEKYKKEFSSSISRMNSSVKNPNYGKHWFTNINTGESVCFLNDPGFGWIKGRYCLNGQYCKITKRNDCQKVAEERWDRFHSGNWNSLSDFDRAEGRSIMTSCMLFKCSIPAYSRMKSYSKFRRFKSDARFIGVYK